MQLYRFKCEIYWILPKLAIFTPVPTSTQDVLAITLLYPMPIWPDFQYGCFTIHASPTSIPREAYFPTFGLTTTSKMAHAASEVGRMRIDQLKKYLTDQLVCSFLKYENNILQLHKKWPCSKVAVWGVKMKATLWQCLCVEQYYVRRAWNQNLSTHLPECSTLSQLSHLNWMRAQGLWNGRMKLLQHRSHEVLWWSSAG